MKDNKTLLLEGLQILRKSDEEVEYLIAPRSDEIITNLNLYIKEIELFNPAYGLVGTTDTNELVIKHILDSLTPVGIISRLLGNAKEPLAEAQRRGERREETEREKAVPLIADAGSGAGFPGIPLAIVLNQCNFTLIERMGRRAGFLLNTKASLSTALSNVNIEESELEQVANNLSPESRFNLITFRAFKPLEPKLLKTLLKACAPNGIIAAYKGKREKIEEEMEPLTAKSLVSNWEAIPYKVPFLDEERHLLVIKNN